MKLNNGLSLDINRMKFFFFYFLLTFFTIFNAFSNDIEEFEIGQISLGKSLLEYVEKNQLDLLREDHKNSDDAYIVYEISKKLPIDGFDFVDVITKKNDSKFIIEAISAAVYYDELDQCLKLKSEMEKEIESIFDANEKQDTKFPSNQDITGESMVYGTQYYTKPFPSNESVIVNCYHMSKKSNINRALRLSVNSHGYAGFIMNKSEN